jgi:methyltransferase (TIGR00027 family)
MKNGHIKHVSDTALWAASFRAPEGRRPDAAFDDPLASILVGDRGLAIARAMPRAPMVDWGMVIRTSAIDHLINDALSAGVDTVVNLGAGLDTRPYRMDLPATLRWVEVDFPSIVALKDSLIEQPPVCRLERIGVDLLDRPARSKLLARYAADSQNTLFITEGVIPYFSVHDAAVLAGDLHAASASRFWIQDFDNAGKRRLPRGWETKLKAAPFLFEVKDWFGFFEKYGWRPARVTTNLEESRRINRPYPLDFPFGLILRALPRAARDRILSLSGAVLMQRVKPAHGRAETDPGQALQG